jgi:hypothetical protein
VPLCGPRHDRLEAFGREVVALSVAEPDVALSHFVDSGGRPQPRTISVDKRGLHAELEPPDDELDD